MIIKDYVLQEKEKIRNKVSNMGIKPHLVIVQVNDDEASSTYVRGKLKDCEEVGVRADLIRLAVTASQEELLSVIEKLNHDPDVHGFIVQMPLPKQIKEDIIKAAVAPSKDVDGFHPLSKMDPCTPKGIIDYLTSEGIDFTGKNAVVIGRSNIVGKPMARLLTAKNCNTTVLHSKTRPEDMAFYLEHADIVVVAIGKKEFLTGEHLKKTAVVVDVGINRFEGKLYGDAKAGLDVALQTPVPGGVGLLTRLTLIKNLLEAYSHGIQN